MSHLSPERLAALADSEPAASEVEHLRTCAHCARARLAYERLLVLAAAERERVGPPLTSWDGIAAAMKATAATATAATGDRRPATGPAGALRLEGTGIGRDASAPARRTPKAAVFVRPTILRAAAAIGLLAAGALLGRLSAGSSALPGSADAALVARVAGPGTTATPVADGARGDFATVDDALAALAASERDYQRAVAWLADNDTLATPAASDSIEAYRARLAALDELAAASRAALYAAPQDPVLNRYYLSTLGAREATLRQMNTALPVGTRMVSY